MNLLVVWYASSANFSVTFILFFLETSHPRNTGMSVTSTGFVIDVHLSLTFHAVILTQRRAATQGSSKKTRGCLALIHVAVLSRVDERVKRVSACFCYERLNSRQQEEQTQHQVTPFQESLAFYHHHHHHYQQQQQQGRRRRRRRSQIKKTSKMEWLKNKFTHHYMRKGEVI